MKNWILTFIFAIGLVFFMSSCDDMTKKSANSDQVVAKQTEQMMNESVKQTGLPAIVNWREKKDLKMIYELCDQEKLICHAYLVNELKGEIGQYLGKCRGFGIPYSAQYSNPEKVVRNSNGAAGANSHEHDTGAVGAIQKTGNPQERATNSSSRNTAILLCGS